MFILRDLLVPLQEEFSNTDQGQKRVAKGNQSSYPWSQCILAIGLLKKVKSR